jgi:ribose transport system permease protein
MAKLKDNALMASIRHRAEQSLAFASLVVIFIFFTFANSAFATWSNITGILLSTAVIGLLAIGTTFVIITGGIDLSIGTGVTLTSVMVAWSLNNMGMPIWIGIIVGILSALYTVFW